MRTLYHALLLPADCRRPVFMVGLPRSGTTLVEQILASHSQVHGAGERRFARQSFESLPKVMNLDVDPFGCLPRLDRETVARPSPAGLAATAVPDYSREITAENAKTAEATTWVN